MKKTTSKLLLAAVFGLVLSSSVIAGEDVDAFTLSFENNVNIEPVSVFVSNVSYTPGNFVTNSVLAMCYDSEN
jgi:hypothetical protein